MINKVNLLKCIIIQKRHNLQMMRLLMLLFTSKHVFLTRNIIIAVIMDKKL